MNYEVKKDDDNVLIERGYIGNLADYSELKISEKNYDLDEIILRRHLVIIIKLNYY